MDLHELVINADEEFIKGNTFGAINIINNYLSISSLDSKNLDDIYSNYKAGCLLIDFGMNTYDENLVIKGIQIIENEKYKKYFTQASFYYNLGNGKKSLFDIKRKGIDFYSEDLLELILSAKNYYLKCLNNNDPIDPTFKYEILVNTANAIDMCGRPIEALYLYNQALAIDSNRFEANASKATALIWLNELSNQFTPQMLFNIKHHIEIALKNAPTYFNTKELENRLYETIKIIIELGPYDEDYLNHQLKFFKYDNLTPDNKFNILINNGLYLSQHSTYCMCQIAKDERSQFSKLLPARKGLKTKINLIRLFKRIIKEYYFARELFVKSQKQNRKADFSYIETLTMCYRISYSILDKIARFIVISENESLKADEIIVFDSFWSRKPNIRKKALSSQNYNLFALYSIARDLEQKNGELNFLKDWRNHLEHSVVVFTERPPNNFENIFYVEKKIFIENAPKLLRLIKSAIFCCYFLIKEPI